MLPAALSTPPDIWLKNPFRFGFSITSSSSSLHLKKKVGVCKSSTVHKEAMLAIGALAYATDQNLGSIA
ncbi:hypothetical protein L6452_32528 [Arctium lappa]|uniref:Uncharacterized protein n=1 Tax=Arctium lappa TaxID=4217 RepID=A0ACB8Z4T2_ARCLA|nr:hypothetical protein L6452_32528 [Arctium lappa]